MDKRYRLCCLSCLPRRSQEVGEEVGVDVGEEVGVDVSEEVDVDVVEGYQ